MGASVPRRYRLQVTDAFFKFKYGLPFFVWLLSLVNSAHAQIIPLHGTLEYTASANVWPTLTVKAANGSAAYVLTLLPERDVSNNLSHIDLVLHRPRTRDDAPNLLDPPYRWHGLQDYMFNAIDFKDGPEHSI